MVHPSLPLSPGGSDQWWHRAGEILTVLSPAQCYTPIAFSNDNNAYGLALHAYKYDIAHDHVHGRTPALLCLIRHLGRVSGQGPSITFEDWTDATPPPPWRDNYHEVDLLCLVAKQLNIELGLPSDKTYAYVSSLLWQGVQLQLLSLSKPIHEIELVFADIAYWRFELLKLKSIIVELVEIRHHSRFSNVYMQLDALTTALDVLTQDKRALQQLVQVHAMSKSGQVASLSPTNLPLTLASHREMPISSPIPTTTQERGGDHQSMSVVYTPTTLPPTSSSHLHHHQARLGEVPTLPVHSYTAKQPPKDTSPRQRGKSSYSPSLPITQERAGRLSAKNKSRYSIKEFDAAVTIQRFRRNLRKRRLKRLRIQLRYRKRQAVIVLQRYTRGMLIRRPRQRFARTKQLLRSTSDYTKLLQSQRGGNRRPPPTPFETPIGSNDSGPKSFQHPFQDRGIPLPSRKKTRRGKRKKRTCHTGRRHTPNAPDPILDCGGVPWCISDDTTNKSIKFTDFDDTSTDPVCMPLVYWSTQTTATINLLRPEQSTNTVYLPYISTATAAARIIQHAYTKHVNHLSLYHQQSTTNVEIVNIPPTQPEVIPASFTDIFTKHMQDYYNTRPITLC